jgi:prepilin-type processing-associated H-X9-DG protein
MKTIPSRALEAAFTLIELLIVMAFVCFLAMFLFPRMGSHSQGRPMRINCVNNLKQVGLAFRTWALDHNDRYPMEVPRTNSGTMELASTAPAFMHFLVLSNELSTPKILFCPADSRPGPPTNFISDLDNSKISYFVGVDAVQTNPQMFLAGDRNITNGIAARHGFLELTTNQLAGWTQELHKGQGNVGLADGSVQQFSTSRLRQAIEATGVATNRLAMP